MSKKVLLTKGAFEKLLAGLLYMEEEKDNIIDEYFPEGSPQRDQVKEKMEEYILQADELVRNAKKAEKADNSIPFVIIHSKVELQDLDTNCMVRLKIVPPMQNNEIDDASMFSPVGMSLLLKKAGEKVMVAAPTGFFRYRIQSITLPFP